MAKRKIIKWKDLKWKKGQSLPFFKIFDEETRKYVNTREVLRKRADAVKARDAYIKELIAEGGYPVRRISPKRFKIHRFTTTIAYANAKRKTKRHRNTIAAQFRGRGFIGYITYKEMGKAKLHRVEVKDQSYKKAHRQIHQKLRELEKREEMYFIRDYGVKQF